MRKNMFIILLALWSALFASFPLWYLLVGTVNGYGFALFLLENYFLGTIWMAGFVVGSFIISIGVLYYKSGGSA